MEIKRGGRQLIGFLPITPEILSFQAFAAEESNWLNSDRVNSGCLTQTLLTPLTIELSESETKHALNVLRLTEGAILRIVDPQLQMVAQGRLKIVKKTAFVEIEVIGKQLKKYCNVIIGFPEPKIAESCVEKLTEIGVNNIYFFKADHSQISFSNLIKLTSRLNKKRDVAIKQSYSLSAPEIQIVENLALTLDLLKENSLITLFSPKDAEEINSDGLKLENLKDLLLTSLNSSSLIIGPEGGFSKNELKLLIEKQSRFLTLGTNTLRVETAACVSLANLNCLLET